MPPQLRRCQPPEQDLQSRVTGVRVKVVCIRDPFDASCTLPGVEHVDDHSACAVEAVCNDLWAVWNARFRSQPSVGQGIHPAIDQHSYTIVSGPTVSMQDAMDRLILICATR